MADFKLKKGYDLNIAGVAEKKITTLDPPEKVAVLPLEFWGIKPKLQAAVGDKVKIGSVLFQDKQNEDLKFVSPVSGKVSAINRGERRAITEIVIENDKKDTTEKIGEWSASEIEKLNRDEIIAYLLKGGMWPLFRQRPFNYVADPNITPRDIFISALDTAPLANDPNFIIEGEAENFQNGLDIIQKLTDGKVYLSTGFEPAKAYANAKNVEINRFKGPHPAGNVGVQIHCLKRIKIGDKVWHIQPYHVALIGKFFKEGVYQRERIVAAAGSSLKNGQYYKTIVGTPINQLIDEAEIKDKNWRVITGNVLTGKKTALESYTRFYANLLSVIPEGKKDRKLLGYFRPGLDLPSFSKTFFSSLFPGKTFEMDTRMFGGKRAFVQSGDYEKVMPMDVYPVYLAKSILTEDIEEMEKLGIYEVEEEDIALCSYICLSKTDFGGLVRKGLKLIEKEG
jgi:Na+-transporting NADH:ubiquinone oxidoreductase subunit A